MLWLIAIQNQPYRINVEFKTRKTKCIIKHSKELKHSTRNKMRENQQEFQINQPKYSAVSKRNRKSNVIVNIHAQVQ